MSDVSLVDERRWQEAERRVAVLRPLLGRSRGSREAVRSAAYELGLS